MERKMTTRITLAYKAHKMILLVPECRKIKSNEFESIDIFDSQGLRVTCLTIESLSHLKIKNEPYRFDAITTPR